MIIPAATTTTTTTTRNAARLGKAKISGAGRACESDRGMLSMLNSLYSVVFLIGRRLGARSLVDVHSVDLGAFGLFQTHQPLYRIRRMTS